MRNALTKTLLTLVLILTAFVSVQSQTPYQKDWKYNFFSNWTVSASAVGTKTLDFQDFTLGSGTNIGCDIRLSKRIAQAWDLRYIAEIPGFVTAKDVRSFDRYGKLMSGIEFRPVRWAYLFADAGVGCNPSNVNILGIACDAGLGLSAKTGNWTRMFVEVGADRCQNVATNQLNDWNSNLFAKLGLAVSLGITEGDYQGIMNRNNQYEKISNLETENEALKKTNNELVESNCKLSSALENTTESCKKLESDLNDCLENCRKEQEQHADILQIYFEYASCEISDIESEKIERIYSRMDNETEYTVNGYCSDNGDDHRNQVLSEKRAEAVKKALVRLGADASKLNAVGHGKVKGGDSPLNQMVEITW